MIGDLEGMLMRLAAVGAPRLSKQSDGTWHCSFDFPTPEGVTAEVRSDFNHRTPQEALQKCIDRLGELQQLFCCGEHKRTWHNRAQKRGAKLFPLACAARETRDGTRGHKATGKEASHQANTIMQRWRDEDSKAGRMGQVEYLRRRLAMGFDAI